MIKQWLLFHPHWPEDRLGHGHSLKGRANALTLSGVCFSSQGNYFCYFSHLQPPLDGWLGLALDVQKEVSPVFVQHNFHSQITVTGYSLRLRTGNTGTVLLLSSSSLRRTQMYIYSYKRMSRY